MCKPFGNLKCYTKYRMVIQVPAVHNKDNNEIVFDAKIFKKFNINIVLEFCYR